MLTELAAWWSWGRSGGSLSNRGEGLPLIRYLMHNDVHIKTIFSEIAFLAMVLTLVWCPNSCWKFRIKSLLSVKWTAISCGIYFLGAKPIAPRSSYFQSLLLILLGYFNRGHTDINEEASCPRNRFFCHSPRFRPQSCSICSWRA